MLSYSWPLSRISYVSQFLFFSFRELSLLRGKKKVCESRCIIARALASRRSHRSIFLHSPFILDCPLEYVREKKKEKKKKGPLCVLRADRLYIYIYICDGCIYSLPHHEHITFSSRHIKHALRTFLK